MPRQFRKFSKVKYFIYLNVPEYVKEWALQSFGLGQNYIHLGKCSALHGWVSQRLIKRRTYHPQEESGNLAVEIWNVSCNQQKTYYNYMTRRDRERLGSKLFQIMFSEYFFWILPYWRMVRAEHTRGRKQHTMEKYTLMWLEMKGVTFDERALLRFTKEFYRERARIRKVHDVELK